MTFTATYRDATGALKTVTAEAATRTEALAAFRARGITPTSVVESGKKKTASRPMPKGALRGLVAGLLVVVAALGIWYALAPSAPAKPGEKKVQAPAKPKREAAKKPAAEKAKSAPAKKPAAKPAAPPAETVATAPATNAAPTLPTATALPPPRSAQPVFDNASDQVLAMIASDDGRGMAPIPISANIEKEFLESLKKEIKILDTDDERTRALKESVIDLRAQMKQLLDEGKTVGEVIREHQELMNQNAKIRNDAMLELKGLLDAGDIEGAKVYKRKVNLALQQMGIKEMEIPVTDEERAARQAERRARAQERRAEQEARAAAADALDAAQQGQ